MSHMDQEFYMNFIRQRMKKILITGSTGYVGSALSEYLLSLGYDCTGVDSGFFANSLISNPVQTKTIYKDVRDIDESFKRI